MTQILIFDYWADLPLSVPAIFEEIATIDRVINKRIQNAVKAYSAGVIPRPVDLGPYVDDLLWRRQRLSDLAQCLLVEDSFEMDQADRQLLKWLTLKVARQPKHPRFP